MLWLLVIRLMTVSLILGSIQTAPARSECSSTECIEAAKYLKSRLDGRKDPCDDFYDFACGDFEKTASVGSNVFSEITKTTIRRILGIFKSNPANIALVKAIEFFNICLSFDDYQEHPLRPIWALITAAFGQWPSSKLSNGINTDTIFTNLSKIGRSVGFEPNSVLSVNIIPNCKDPNRRVIVITPPALALMKLNEEVPQQYIRSYVQLIMLIGLQFVEYDTKGEKVDPQQEFVIFTHLMEAVNLELALVKAMPARSELKDVYESFDTITIAQAQETYPFFNWLNFISAVLGPEVPISSSEKIVIYSTKYVEKLEEIFTIGYERPLTNYLIWKYIVYGLRLTMSANKQAKYGTCLTLTMTGFDVPIAKRYIELYFSDAEKAPVAEMSNTIQQVMYDDFKNFAWVDNNTRKYISDKIYALVKRIAYSDDLLQNKALESRYSNMVLIPDSFFLSTMSLSKFILDYMAETLHETINRIEWPYFVSTLSVNAFYMAVDNSITIPAALLQDKIYSRNQPAYLNYGTIGYVVGHELSHAFDNNGRLFDKNGRRVDNLWSTMAANAYDDKTQCFVQQYGNTIVQEIGIHLDGAQTLGENIADNEGVRRAYKAYNLWVKTHGEEDGLPGMNYSPRQLFWISMASLWCSKISKENLQNAIKTDPHAPAKYRVNGMVSNRLEFANDFSCPKGSKMNPLKKCSFQ